MLDTVETLTLPESSECVLSVLRGRSAARQVDDGELDWKVLVWREGDAAAPADLEDLERRSARSSGACPAGSAPATATFAAQGHDRPAGDCNFAAERDVFPRLERGQWLPRSISPQAQGPPETAEVPGHRLGGARVVPHVPRPGPRLDAGAEFVPGQRDSR